MLRDLGDLSRMAAGLPEELKRAQGKAIRQGAAFVTREIRGQIKIASGGDNRLSGVGARGARVGARYDVRGDVNPTAIIKATGPLHLIERNTKSHPIQVRKRGKKHARALKLSSGDFRSSVLHPGTKGKHPFEKGFEKAKDEPARLFSKAIDDVMRKAIA